MGEPNRNRFGLELQKAMHGITNLSDLAARMTEQKDYPLTRAYIGMIAHGDRRPNSQLVDAICRALNLTGDAKQKLHRAACLDLGYKIGKLVDG